MNLLSKETNSSSVVMGVRNKPAFFSLHFGPSPYSVVAKGLKNIMTKKVRPCIKS
jgi:hypothetical protein